MWIYSKSQHDTLSEDKPVQTSVWPWEWEVRVPATSLGVALGPCERKYTLGYCGSDPFLAMCFFFFFFLAAYSRAALIKVRSVRVSELFVYSKFSREFESDYNPL